MASFDCATFLPARRVAFCNDEKTRPDEAMSPAPERLLSVGSPEKEERFVSVSLPRLVFLR
jgi:hypothetical protein